MTLRSRLLLAFAAVVLIPTALLAFGLRYTMTARLSDQYERRLEAVLEVIDGDLQRESAAIAERLDSLRLALAQDNSFRGGAVAGDPREREYVLDYAGRAMRLTGLSMLQVHDAEGRILSSGHFRNEHGRLEPEPPAALSAREPAGASGDSRRSQTPPAQPVTLMTARSPEGAFLALARAASLVIGGRTFTLVGGVVVDEAFLQRLSRDRDIVVTLEYAGGTLSSHAADASARNTPAETAVTSPRTIPLLDGRTLPLQASDATLVVSQPITPLRALLRETDTWFIATAAGTSVMALLLAFWISSRISRPLAELAEKTAVLDLDRLDVRFDGGTDEVGRLAQLLGDLASRLRTSTGRIRDAERRATVGDLARQINHDIKNGLIPLRNVMRHLTQVAREDPGGLPAVLEERRPTIDSSLGYLETLATNYERLSPAPARRDCDLNALVSNVLEGAHGYEHAELRAELSPQVPRVTGDPVAIRRVLENLIANAVDSLDSKPGRVTISTELVTGADGTPVVRLIVADTGHGMSREESSRIFADFYTTKPGGTGLGLSIVRRLVMDLHGSLRVESEPGAGTRMIVEIPAAGRSGRRETAADHPRSGSRLRRAL